MSAAHSRPSVPATPNSRELRLANSGLFSERPTFRELDYVQDVWWCLGTSLYLGQPGSWGEGVDLGGCPLRWTLPHHVHFPLPTGLGRGIYFPSRTRICTPSQSGQTSVSHSGLVRVTAGLAFSSPHFPLPVTIGPIGLWKSRALCEVAAAALGLWEKDVSSLPRSRASQARLLAEMLQ